MMQGGHHRTMGSRERAVVVGSGRGRTLATMVLRELRNGRLDRGLSGREIAHEAGISPAQYSRVERGQTDSVSIEQASALLAIVGLELSVRVFPAGEPIRDRAHAALIDRLRSRVHASLRVRTEVPFPGPSDRRAWDVVISGAGWRMGVEAETRPRDLQALDRRMALKLRDGDVESASLLLLDSRFNRDFMRAHGRTLAERFPVPGRRALACLANGADPGGGAVILL